MNPLSFLLWTIVPALGGLLYPYVKASPQHLGRLVTALPLYTCLFVFPALGYLFIPFTRTKQGLHDRLAETFVITKRAVLKALCAWLVILGICGGTGWQAYSMMGGWFSYMFNTSAYGSEITLEAHWTQEFGTEEHLPLMSFLNRGTHSLVSTTQSVYAVDMLTGEMLWQTDKVSNLTLHTLSDDPDFPLLGLQHDDKGRTTLTRLDPANGNILWQHTLDGSTPRIHFDTRHIVALDGSRISLYTVEGEQLWQRTFQDRFLPQTVALHRGILLGRYAKEKMRLSYLDRKSGELLWERENSEFIPAYSIPNIEQQFFYAEEGQTMLLDLNTQEALWDTPQDLGYVLGHTVEKDSGQLSLHTTTGMVRQQNGELLFSYPAGFRLVGATDEYLILLQGSGGRQNSCLLLDKNSGATVQQFHERDWFAIFYLSEDANAIFLAVNSTPGRSRDTSVHTSIVRLDKHTWELKEIPVGRNIGTIRFKIFPQEGLVFIPLYQRIGGYLLPEM